MGFSHQVSLPCKVRKYLRYILLPAVCDPSYEGERILADESTGVKVRCSDSDPRSVRLFRDFTFTFLFSVVSSHC